MIFARQTPPLGEGARAWVEANKDRLPQDYKAITVYPTGYRRAIFAELSPAARSNFRGAAGAVLPGEHQAVVLVRLGPLDRLSRGLPLERGHHPGANAV